MLFLINILFRLWQKVIRLAKDRSELSCRLFKTENKSARVNPAPMEGKTFSSLN